MDAINKASAEEKGNPFLKGHPRNLHQWWARRPHGAARAVIFAQMVDDPPGYLDLFPTEKAQEKERKRLFRIIEDLVLWENTTDEKVLANGTWRHEAIILRPDTTFPGYAPYIFNELQGSDIGVIAELVAVLG